MKICPVCNARMIDYDVTLCDTCRRGVKPLKSIHYLRQLANKEGAYNTLTNRQIDIIHQFYLELQAEIVSGIELVETMKHVNNASEYTAHLLYKGLIKVLGITDNNIKGGM